MPQGVTSTGFGVVLSVLCLTQFRRFDQLSDCISGSSAVFVRKDAALAASVSNACYPKTFVVNSSFARD